jgi:hypothetical protein
MKFEQNKYNARFLLLPCALHFILVMVGKKEMLYRQCHSTFTSEYFIRKINEYEVRIQLHGA